MRFIMLMAASCVFVCCTVSLPAQDLPAFPGAEGFGATTVGGRGGRVIEVTNTNDHGPGSLRAAAGAEGPRIIVFRVSGTIEVDSPIEIVHPYLTIAGQTAPGGGITLKNSEANLYAPLQVKTHDVVIRYIRSRPGLGGIPPATHDGSNVDALTIADLQHDVYNVVIDHCSFSWSVDEIVNSWYDAHDVTVQWCIMSEGLHNPERRQGSGSKGPLFGGKGSGRISVHHNLLAHNLGRNPMIKASGVVDLVNNVMFIPGTIAAVVDGELGACHVNVVGNAVLAPNGDGLVHGLAILNRYPVTIYAEGNLGPYRTDASQPEELFVSPRNAGRSRIVPGRAEAPTVTAWSAGRALEVVLEQAGCVRPVRDAVDERVIADVIARRARVISDPQEVGGWPELADGDAPADSDHDGMPDDWEQQHGFNADDPRDQVVDADSDGYTNIEEYLNLTDPLAE